MGNFLIVFNEFIQKYLNPIAVVVSLIASIPLWWTWYEVIFGRKKRHKLYVRNAINQKGVKPALLVVDLNSKMPILDQVESLRLTDSTLKEIPKQRVFNIQRMKWLDHNDIPAIVMELRENMGKIAKSGADLVYLIYSGPVIPAAIIGAELANSFKVRLLQHQEGQYVNWGPLKHV